MIACRAETVPALRHRTTSARRSNASPRSHDKIVIWPLWQSEGGLTALTKTIHPPRFRGHK
jgi:hypothetical protein